MKTKRKITVTRTSSRLKIYNRTILLDDDCYRLSANIEVTDKSGMAGSVLLDEIVDEVIQMYADKRGKGYLVGRQHLA